MPRRVGPFDPFPVTSGAWRNRIADGPAGPRLFSPRRVAAKGDSQGRQPCCCARRVGAGHRTDRRRSQRSAATAGGFRTPAQGEVLTPCIQWGFGSYCTPASTRDNPAQARSSVAAIPIAIRLRARRHRPPSGCAGNGRCGRRASRRTGKPRCNSGSGSSSSPARFARATSRACASQVRSKP